MRTRILHWLTAVLVFSTLFIGFVMVNSTGSYASLRAVHMTLGVLILVIVVVRAANRFTHRVPKLPDTVGWLEHKLVVGSELTMYALLLAQPLSDGRWCRRRGSRRTFSGHCICHALRRSMPTCISYSAKHIRCWPTHWWPSLPRMSARYCCIH